MITLGALLMVLGIVGFVLMPSDALTAVPGPAWVDAASFAIVVLLVAGVFVTLVGCVKFLMGG